MATAAVALAFVASTQGASEAFSGPMLALLPLSVLVGMFLDLFTGIITKRQLIKIVVFSYVFTLLATEVDPDFRTSS